MKNRPKVGLATIVKKGNTLLLGKRINSHGDNTLSFPEGHLEYFEFFIDCAIRELKEETGLIYREDILYLHEEPLMITNDFFKKENKHYITLYIEAQQISNKEPIIMEPNKLEFWKYYTWKEVLENYNKLFLPIQNLIKQGYKPFD